MPPPGHADAPAYSRAVIPGPWGRHRWMPVHRLIWHSAGTASDEGGAAAGGRLACLGRTSASAWVGIGGVDWRYERKCVRRRAGPAGRWLGCRQAPAGASRFRRRAAGCFRVRLRRGYHRPGGDGGTRGRDVPAGRGRARSSGGNGRLFPAPAAMGGDRALAGLAFACASPGYARQPTAARSCRSSRSPRSNTGAFPY